MRSSVLRQWIGLGSGEFQLHELVKWLNRMAYFGSKTVGSEEVLLAFRLMIIQRVAHHLLSECLNNERTDGFGLGGNANR